MNNHNAYVSAFVTGNHRLIADCSESLLTFLNDSAKLCSAMTLAPESVSVEEREFDTLMPCFVNGLSINARRDLFTKKLLDNTKRQDIIFSFLQTCNETGSTKGDVELIDVTDFSTWRARIPGHVVYKIDLLLEKSRLISIYITGVWKNRISLVD